MASVAAELEWIRSEPVAETRAWAESKLFPVFRQYGFRAVQETDQVVLFSRRRTAWWLALFSVVAFWLSPDEKGQIMVSFMDAPGGGSRMTVFGDVPAPVRRVLLDMPGCRETFSR